MALVYGKKYTREELLKRVGNIAQLAGVRPVMYREGKADGIKAFDVSNGGGLKFTVLEGKCLDLFDAEYKGMKLNFHSKPGLVSPSLVEADGMKFLRSVPGGMLYTCGLTNVGPGCDDEGMDHCFHGRIRNIPAEKVSVISRWEQDEYIVGVSGEMRDAALFHENLVLRRKITTRLGFKCLTINDEVENEGYENQAIMLMYHINVGYPILDEGTRLLLPENNVLPRDEESAAGLGEYDKLTAPVDHFKEHVFFHKIAAEENGNTAAAVINDRLGLGFYVKFNKIQLPNLIQWKSMMSGDYVLGIEPANCLCNGRLDEKERSMLKRIAPFQKMSFDIELGVLEGTEEINEFEEYIRVLNKDCWRIWKMV
jgi:hypothetical protein